MSRSFKPLALVVLAVVSLTFTPRVFLAFAALTVGQPVQAEEDHGHEIVFGTEARKSLARFVGELPDQVQRISTAAMMMALGVDGAEHLGGIEKSRDFFLRVLKILNEGDAQHGIPPATAPKVLEALNKLEGLWLSYDAMIGKGLEAGGFGTEDLLVIARLAAPLSAATNDVADAYGEVHSKVMLRSILVPVTEESERQSVRIQEMFRDYLLIAYGHEVDKRRQSLAASIADFERVLTGLIQGDPELRLLAAVNAEIGGQLRQVQRVWKGLRPHMTAAVGGEVDRAKLLRVAGLVDELYHEMHEVADLYDDL